MNTSKRLLHSYTGYIKTPWRPDVAAPQRVIFCIYPETEELRLRAHLDGAGVLVAQHQKGHLVAVITQQAVVGRQPDQAGW